MRSVRSLALIGATVALAALAPLASASVEKPFHAVKVCANFTCVITLSSYRGIPADTVINYTPGTRSHADYTGEADKNFTSSQVIFESILKREQTDPHGLNGFILLLHIGSGPGRSDKFHARFGALLDHLADKGYEFVRVDELLESKGKP